MQKIRVIKRYYYWFSDHREYFFSTSASLNDEKCFRSCTVNVVVDVSNRSKLL